MGGGVGLVCVADRVVADQQAVFATPEVTLGIVPAQIAPLCCAGWATAWRVNGCWAASAGPQVRHSRQAWFRP